MGKNVDVEGNLRSYTAYISKLKEVLTVIAEAGETGGLVLKDKYKVEVGNFSFAFPYSMVDRESRGHIQLEINLYRKNF